MVEGFHINLFNKKNMNAPTWEDVILSDEEIKELQQSTARIFAHRSDLKYLKSIEGEKLYADSLDELEKDFEKYFDNLKKKAFEIFAKVNPLEIRQYAIQLAIDLKYAPSKYHFERVKKEYLAEIIESKKKEIFNLAQRKARRLRKLQTKTQVDLLAEKLAKFDSE